MLVILTSIPFAADGSADEDEKHELVEYVEVEASALPASNTIATKLAVPTQITPANIGTVDLVLFQEQGGVVLSDALRNQEDVPILTQRVSLMVARRR